MKHFGKQLDEILTKRRIKNKDFAKEIGVSAQTSSKWKNNHSIDAEMLERISKLLDIPIVFWFDDTLSIKQSVVGNGNASSIFGDAVVNQLADKDKEIAHLKELLAEKERTIQILLADKKNLVP